MELTSLCLLGSVHQLLPPAATSKAPRTRTAEVSEIGIAIVVRAPGVLPCLIVAIHRVSVCACSVILLQLIKLVLR